MYSVFDSTGKLLRGGFSSSKEAENWKFSRGNNPKWKIK
jgi:hypothetical protein